LFREGNLFFPAKRILTVTGEQVREEAILSEMTKKESHATTVLQQATSILSPLFDTYVFTFVVIHDQLYYKGAMLGSSTPSITLSISAKSCMTSSKAISAHPSRSSCERD
jgi:hypothetical protein